MTRQVLVTGASRGLGLEHCRQFAARGFRVIAAARQPGESAPLADLQRTHPDHVRLVQLDVRDDAAVLALAVALQDQPLDLLINNAGSFGPEGAPAGLRYQSLTGMDYDIWRDILEINLLAPLRLTTALAASLRRASSPLIVMMSSDLGSISNNRQGQSHAYRTSKAALNMLTRGIAVDWPEVIVVSMAPGWCQTSLGGPDAPLAPADSVRDQQATFDRLTLADSGAFLDRFGSPVPW